MKSLLITRVGRVLLTENRYESASPMFYLFRGKRMKRMHVLSMIKWMLALFFHTCTWALQAQSWQVLTPQSLKVRSSDTIGEFVPVSYYTAMNKIEIPRDWLQFYRYKRWKPNLSGDTFVSNQRAFVDNYGWGYGYRLSLVIRKPSCQPRGAVDCDGGALIRARRLLWTVRSKGGSPSLLSSNSHVELDKKRFYTVDSDTSLLRAQHNTAPPKSQPTSPWRARIRAQKSPTQMPN